MSGANATSSTAKASAVANVGMHLLHARRSNEIARIGRGIGRQRIPHHGSPKLREPERQPGTLEARVAGQEDPFATPEACVRGQKMRQGACPLSHRSSSKRFSRSVSIGCQKPSCSKAINCPSRANCSIGPRSHTVSSPST